MPEGLMDNVKSLEQLSRIMQVTPDKVSVQDIMKVFGFEEEEIKKQFEIMGKDLKEDVKDSALRNLRAMRDKMIQELESLRNMAVSDRTKALNESRLETAKVKIKMEIEGKRHEKRGSCYGEAEKLADQIDDYEGIDALHNKTKDTLTGYLAAFYEVDPEKAKLEFDKAKLAYEKADNGLMNFDRVLKYDDMVEAFGIRNYGYELDRYELTDDSRGLLMGYLSLADKILTGKEKEEYRTHLFDTLKGTQGGGDLAAKSFLEKDKRPEQRQKLEAVYSPAEWKEMGDKVADERVKMLQGDLKDGVNKILELIPGFTIDDPSIKAILQKSRELVGRADEEAVKTATAAVQKLFSDFVGTKTKEIKGQIEAFRKKVAELTQGLGSGTVAEAVSKAGETLGVGSGTVAETGKALGAVTDAVLNEIEKLMDKVESALAGMVIKDGDPISVLVMNAQKMKDLLGDYSGLATKVTGL